MTDSRPQQSMEDILASIRSIIAEGGEAAAEPRQPGTVADALAEPTEPSAESAEPEHGELLELARLAREGGDADLISPEVRSSASETISTLETVLVRGYAGSENTLEGLVREMLRPQLKAWLDANLPALVERMVAREIARITAK